MKALALTVLATALMTQVSQAAPTKSLHCSFTEPFFNIDLDIAKKELSKTEPDWDSNDGSSKTTILGRNVTLKADVRDPLAPKYALLDENRQVIARLQLDMTGSDGMSDIRYPIAIQYAGYHGGCSTDKLKPVDPNN